MLLGLDFLFFATGWLAFVYGAMGRKKSTNIYGGAKVGVGGGGEGEGVITVGGGSVHGNFVFYHRGGGGGGGCVTCVCV